MPTTPKIHKPCVPCGGHGFLWTVTSEHAAEWERSTICPVCKSSGMVLRRACSYRGFVDHLGRAWLERNGRCIDLHSRMWGQDVWRVIPRLCIKLAEKLLCEVVDDTTAEKLSEHYADRIVSKLPKEWSIDEDDLRLWCQCRAEMC